MEVIKKKRGRPAKIKTEGKGGLDITIKHSQDSDSDSDNDYNDGADGKGAAGGLDLKKAQKNNASNFVAREKAATEKPMVGGKVFQLTEAQIKDLIK